MLKLVRVAKSTSKHPRSTRANWTKSLAGNTIYAEDRVNNCVWSRWSIKFEAFKTRIHLVNYSFSSRHNADSNHDSKPIGVNFCVRLLFYRRALRRGATANYRSRWATQLVDRNEVETVAVDDLGQELVWSNCRIEFTRLGRPTC